MISPASIFSGPIIQGIVHDASNLVIVIGYIVAGFAVTPSFQKLIKVRRMTVIGGGLFFLCGGLTHFGIAIGSERQGDVPFWVLLNDGIQAGAIIAFLIGLYLDLQDAVDRVSTAMVVACRQYEQTFAEAQVRAMAGHVIDSEQAAKHMVDWTAHSLNAALLGIDPPPVTSIPFKAD